MFHPFDSHPDHPRGSRGHYDPNQPRVPPGHPDGGQWTSTSRGWPLSDLAQLPAPDLRKPEIPQIPPGMYPEYALLDEQRAPFQAPTRADVASPTRPATPPPTRPSRLPSRMLKGGGWVGLLGLGLWWLYQRLSGEGSDDENVVLEVRAREFRRAPGNVEISEKELNEEQLRKACPDIGLIQRLWNQARNDIGHPSDFNGRDSGAYGDAVDANFKKLLEKVNEKRIADGDPEIFIIDKTLSWDGSKNPKRNAPGSKTPDVLQPRRGFILCGYELTVGKRGVNRDNMLAIVQNASKDESLKDMLIVVLTRVKPSTPPPPQKRMQ